MTLLGRAADVEINSFATLLDALDRRLSHFDAHAVVQPIMALKSFVTHKFHQSKH